MLPVITLGPEAGLEPWLTQPTRLWTTPSHAGSLALAISQPSTALPTPILGLRRIETHPVRVSIPAVSQQAYHCTDLKWEG